MLSSAFVFCSQTRSFFPLELCSNSNRRFLFLTKNINGIKNLISSFSALKIKRLSIQGKGPKWGGWAGLVGAASRVVRTHPFALLLWFLLEVGRDCDYGRSCLCWVWQPSPFSQPTRWAYSILSSGWGRSGGGCRLSQGYHRCDEHHRKLLGEERLYFTRQLVNSSLREARAGTYRQDLI